MIGVVAENRLAMVSTVHQVVNGAGIFDSQLSGPREQPLKAPWSLSIWKLNQLLNKQRLIRYRFPDINARLTHSTVGFWELGEIGEPAIPLLLTLVPFTPKDFL